MLNLNFKQISILDMLLNQEYVENELFEKNLGNSLRTVMSEINTINILLRENGKKTIQILNQRGKGYFIDHSLEDLEWMERLKSQCYDYLNYSMNRKLRNYERVPHIVRHLLTREYTRADSLAESLNVSMATLNKDLRVAREYLGMYGIQVLSIPHYGMKPAGDEMAIRMCMIDFCDLYRLSEDNIFVLHFLREYQISLEDIFSRKERLRTALKEAAYPVTDFGFIRLVYYLSILPLRKRFPVQMDQIPPGIRKTREFGIAKRLLEGEGEQEVFCFMICILSAADFYDGVCFETFSRLVPEGAEAYTGLCRRLKERFYFDVSLSPQLNDYLKFFVNRFLLRKKYKIFEYEVSRAFSENAKQMPASSALANAVFHLLPGVHKNDFKDYQFYELTAICYSLAYNIKNEYHPTDILLINETGKAANHVILTRLKLTNHNIRFHYHYLYELESLDFTKYEYIIITEGMKYDEKKIPIPVYRCNLFSGVREGVNMWNQMLAKKRKVGAIANYLLHPVITDLLVGEGDALNRITAFFIESHPLMTGMTFQELHSMLTIALLHSRGRGNGKRCISLIARPDLTNRYFIFRFRKPMIFDDEAVEELHIILLDLSKGFVEIKNGDSEIRRLNQ